MLVDGVLQLDLDFPQAIHEDPLLFLREMQRLVRFIGEERITLDVPPQSRTTDQVRMEKQPMRQRPGPILKFNTRHLPGSESYYGSFLIIIILPPIPNIPAFRIFQEKSVYTIINPEISRPCLGLG